MPQRLEWVSPDPMSHDAQSSTEQPFTLPERYQVRRHIATGGMASVWCAEDLVLGRSVAIKVLAERFAHDQLAMRRFKREARAAARVSTHAHVVTVYDVGDLEPDRASDPTHSEPGRAFIVMEYLAGGTVADAIHHDSVRRHEAMRWLREAASALDHAHARDIVHRDIKPANFLLDRGRVLHVADFGIARLTSEDTITTSDQLFGTAAYLSPEQALGREATSASDRYALAVAAFELLVGERPFTTPHFSSQARQHIEESPPAASELNRTLPPAVDDVLFEGLAKDPEARPRSAGAFVAALQHALTEIPPARPPAEPRRRLADATAPAASTAAALGGRGRAPEPRTPAPRSPTTRPPTNRRPPAPSARPGSTPAQPAPRRRRAIALTALLGAAVVLAGIALAATTGAGARKATREAARVVTTTTTTTRHVARAHKPVTRVRSVATTASAPATTPAPPAPTTAAQLQLTGHQEMLDGNYSSAIPVLQKAITASPPSSLTHAYALYDLGRSLVLGGNPSAAIPVLQQRLRIPNQTGTVRQLLDQALAAAAQGQAPAAGTVSRPSTTPTHSTAPSSPPGASHGHGKSGGAGLVGPSGSTTTPGASGPGGHPGRDHGHASGRAHRDAVAGVAVA